MSEHEAERLHQNEIVSIPRYKITRLERTIAKARRDRDEWRKRAEDNESILRDASRDACARDYTWKIGSLQGEIARLKDAIVMRALDGAKESP